ncbi:uncharacterized protein BDR25DRAFT_296289 [Lindgomyces ingoldianus]|uniref:Uncharacterized protein n=1 Tax=Lindgomyces ingoldianus TaxID=673940 RepID=A0ACB6QCV6_9PLEO|nr:uncharacterized protein BDR25DRAFT_296289 [Lindgomyces ingoldianus]KAF2464717.1 hypothetical protein BDR25DRAFT_296289 [Lindgomyces ingoldianus]
MPPKYKGATNALRTFKCDLCNKSYARQTELEAHFSSYDHTHRARMADMKKINASMDSSNSKRKRPEADGEMVTLDPTLGVSEKAAPKFKRVGATSLGTGASEASSTMPGFKRIKPDEEKDRDARAKMDIGMKDGNRKAGITMTGFKRVIPEENVENVKESDIKDTLKDVPALDKDLDSDEESSDDNSDTDFWTYPCFQPQKCDCGCGWEWKIPTVEQLAVPLDQPLDL